MSKILLKTIYKRPGGGTRNDQLMLLIKDVETGEKSVETIINPKIKWYITKPEYRNEPGKVFSIERHKVEERVSEFRNLEKDLAYELGPEGVEFFQAAVRDRDFRRLQELHQIPIFHQTDMNIEDHYIGNFIDVYGTPHVKYSKSFFDIEVDGMKAVDPDSGAPWDGFPDEHVAPAPINAITFFYEETNEVMTYLLRNDENPLIEEFETTRLEAFKERLDEYFHEKFNVDKGTFKYNIRFYDSEMELLKDSLDDNHERKPDFTLAWNMKFDILTMQNRIKHNEIDPRDYFCHPEFPERIMFYKEDTFNDKFQDKDDYFQVSSHTNWMDMMLNYAQLRQGQTELSYALNDIAEKELGEGKFEMEPGVNIVNFPYKNYEDFVFYNIVDVMLLYFMENKLNEVDQLVNVSTLTRTRLNKAMTKTICLKNLSAHLFDEQLDVVLSNNRNKNLEKVRYKGAHVADPANNTGGISLNGIESKYIFENVADFDYRSLYPSIIQLANIASDTQVGKLAFVDFMGINRDTKEDIDESDFTKHVISKDYTMIAQRYMGLNSTLDISKSIKSGKYDHIINKYKTQ